MTGNAYKSNNRGSVAVEFSLLLPILLMILFLIIEYGWYFTNRIVLTDAVYTGAKAAVEAREWNAYGEDPEEFARQAVVDAFWVFKLNRDKDIRITITPRDSAGPRRIEVCVPTLKVRQLTGFLPEFMVPKRLNAHAIMVFHDI